MWSSASDRAADVMGDAPLRVALEIGDPVLERKLRALLARELDLQLTTAADAGVIVTDDPLAVASSRTLVLSDRGGRSGLHLADAELVAAATRLVAAGYAIAQGPAMEPQPGRSRLTSREREVALLLLDGRSNKAIARALDISVHTAKFHVAALLAKLGARNRADAVAIILREGLVPV